MVFGELYYNFVREYRYEWVDFKVMGVGFREVYVDVRYLDFVVWDVDGFKFFEFLFVLY